MKASDLRKLSPKDLKLKLSEQRQEFLNLRFQHAVTPLEKTSTFSEARKSIARILTVLKEKG